MMTEGPLSRPLIVATVPEQGVTIDVVADEAERAALAAGNDVVSVDSFAAKLEVRPASRGAYVVRGVLEAVATRECVVTLEPFAETVREDIDVRFHPEGADDTVGDDEAPEDEIVGGEIDLGTVAAEFFSLGLDPYPRKPGASFEQAGGEDDSGLAFAALGRLKPRTGEPD